MCQLTQIYIFTTFTIYTWKDLQTVRDLTCENILQFENYSKKGIDAGVKEDLISKI